MRIDWYTKGILTVIAVLLAVIAFKQYVSPDAVVQAQGLFAGVLFTDNGYPSFFDARTGDLWKYADYNTPQHLRLTRLGAPLIQGK